MFGTPIIGGGVEKHNASEHKKTAPPGAAAAVPGDDPCQGTRLGGITPGWTSPARRTGSSS